jgi:hypothetical protein
VFDLEETPLTFRSSAIRGRGTTRYHRSVAGGPAAFLSYARFNDQHDDGLISAFRDRLAAEVRAQTGAEFAIFQDRNDIAWGQSWQERIDDALDAATLLVVIVTPGLFASAPCRAEFQRFRERERRLGRTDLILPVYWIEARQIEDPATRADDEMAAALASRQFADWRDLRFEPIGTPVSRRAIAALASRMRDTFWLAAPPIHVVDPDGHGDFTGIQAAIDAASPGDRIHVRPGEYDEHLLIEKPLEIVGDGPCADIVVHNGSTDVVLFDADTGRIANLTLRETGGPGSALLVVSGRLELDGCDIAASAAAVSVIGGDPRVRRNRIQAGFYGVHVSRARGTYEDNDIGGGGVGGVLVGSDGRPVLRNNRIQSTDVAIEVEAGAGGVFEDNDLTGNGRARRISERAGPMIRARNKE